MARTATTLVEERAHGRGGYGWWVGAPVTVRLGVRTAGRAVPAIALPRLAARAATLEASAWCRTPRPGEGRAT
jgi:hypothetical protein